MLLTDIELIILKDIYEMDNGGSKIIINNYALKETENNKRIKEFANHLIRLSKLGYISLKEAFLVAGRDDEVYHNNVIVIYTENIKITGKGIEYIRELETQRSEKNNLHINDKSDNLIEGRGSNDLSSSVFITESNYSTRNLNKSNRQGISAWINEIIPLFSDESTKFTLNVIKERLHNKFDVQWSDDNYKKNAVHIYASNDYKTVYAYLRIEGGLIKSQGPRGIKYENGKVKVHKCIHETKMLTTINNRNVYQFTDILLKALGNPNENINNSEYHKEEEIESISKVTGISSDTCDGPDLLNITKDVSAVSNLIALRNLNTPLSIGIFGDWGSGKSFFMGQVQKNVEEISLKSKAITEKIKNAKHVTSTEMQYKELFCEEIIHINFNAWHYTDANLWASLVSHIFDNVLKNLNRKNGNYDESDQLKISFIKQLESTKVDLYPNCSTHMS